MKLTELYDEINKDFPMDKTDLEEEHMKTSRLFGKYQKLWSDENLSLWKMENDRAKIISKLREYYAGSATADAYFQNKPKYNGIIPKTESGLQKLIEADEVLISYDESVLVQKQKVLVLENCCKEVNSRQYAITSAIKIQMFKNGAY